MKEGKIMIITQINSRAFKIETSTKSLETPFFFPSISSVKTNYEVYDYFQFLNQVSYPGFLISSYDVYMDKKKELLMKEISSITERSAFTLLDSGNYEAYWKNDKDWDIERLGEILEALEVDFCFSFDVFWDEETDINKYISETITISAITAGMQISGETIPIIHSYPQVFPRVVSKIIDGINPQIVSIPERELGTSLLERAKTLKNIRNAIDKMDRCIPIHLLGTGNPTSLLIYTLCGADLFDGLEWCKNVVNPSDAHLYHFIQKELVTCNCRACKVEGLPYHLQTMWHNLTFYENFTEEIRRCITEGKIEELMEKYLPKEFIPKIENIIEFE